jgi:crotonyl-CoA carboxylase/reductase
MSSQNVPIGALPELGDVPDSMFAQVIRSERMGDPRDAFVIEEIAVPEPGPDDVLIAVMAAGVNFNNVWAAKGVPIDVIKARQKGGDVRDYHIGGSDASGIVWAVGDRVTKVKVGEEVVVHHGVWDQDDPWILAQEHQVMPKAPRLTWEEAAVPTLVGTTAYRMLHGWSGNTVAEGDVVLVWGGSGGLGGQAIQLATLAGAQAVAVVSSAERGQYCVDLGAVGYINRKDFEHWGVPPHWDDNEGQREWTGGARAFGKAMWDILGERRNPSIVLEHPGEDTIPTSIFVCDPGGMVVICAGTTGYTAVVDLRYHWTRQKRLQGSHGTNDEQAYAYNQLVVDGKIDPCLGRVARFEEIGEVHYDMDLGRLPPGNTAVLIGAPEPGLGKS